MAPEQLVGAGSKKVLQRRIPAFGGGGGGARGHLEEPPTAKAAST